MRKEMAYTVTDLLLKKPLLKQKNENKTRAMFCMQFAILMLQASVLTQALTDADKDALISNKSRDEIAMEIYKKLTTQNDADALSKAYWETRMCREIDSSSIMSCYGANILDKYSDLV